MQHNIAPKSLTILSFVALLLAGLAPAANAATCSTGTVAGHWGFTLTGTVILPTGPIPVSAILAGKADIDGSVSGTEARNFGGSYADETFTGSWTVNPDCTGVATVSFFESGQLVRTSVVTLVFDDNSKQVRMVQKSLTLPNNAELPVVVTVEGTKH